MPKKTEKKPKTGRPLKGNPKSAVKPSSRSNQNVCSLNPENPPKYVARRYTSYDNYFHPLIAGFMSREGQPLTAIAEEFGCEIETLQRWRDKYPAFKEALDNNGDRLNGLIENALVKSALGYELEYEEEAVKFTGIAIEKLPKTMQEVVEKFQSNTPDVIEIPGTVRVLERQVTKKKKVFPPNVLAIKMWLTNRDKKRWSTDGKLDKNGEGEGDKPSSLIPTDKEALNALTMEELEQLSNIVSKIEEANKNASKENRETN